MTRNILMILVMTALSFFCFWRSHHNSNIEELILNDKQDCSWVHTIPGPANCANGEQMRIVEELRLEAFLFDLCGLVFLFAYITALIVLSWKDKNSKIEYLTVNP